MLTNCKHKIAVLNAIAYSSSKNGLKCKHCTSNHQIPKLKRVVLVFFEVFAVTIGLVFSFKYFSGLPLIITILMLVLFRVAFANYFAIPSKSLGLNRLKRFRK